MSLSLRLYAVYTRSRFERRAAHREHRRDRVIIRIQPFARHGYMHSRDPGVAAGER